MAQGGLRFPPIRVILHSYHATQPNAENRSTDDRRDSRHARLYIRQHQSCHRRRHQCRISSRAQDSEVDEDSIRLFDGGYQSKTTKSRLNAILSTCAFAGECIVQKDFNWFYRKFVGAMNGESVFILKDFESGMFA